VVNFVDRKTILTSCDVSSKSKILVTVLDQQFNEVFRDTILSSSSNLVPEARQGMDDDNAYYFTGSIGDYYLGQEWVTAKYIINDSIISVPEIDMSDYDLIFYPNPFYQNAIIRWESSKAGLSHLRICSEEGKVILEKELVTTVGMNQAELSYPAGGLCVLYLNSPDGRMRHKKIISVR
jgi:hypothetical protein